MLEIDRKAVNGVNGVAFNGEENIMMRRHLRATRRLSRPTKRR